MPQDNPLLEKAKVLKYFKPPFKFDKMGGYVFDKENQMVAEVRAWGYLQYKPDGEKLQDELGEIIAESLTNYYREGASSSVNGGVWVKASERLPEADPKKDLFLKWCIHDYFAYTLGYFTGSYFVSHHKGNLGLDVIWLDESAVSRPSLPKDNEWEKERAEETVIKIANHLYNKWCVHYETGTSLMTKDLFTLALQDDQILKLPSVYKHVETQRKEAFLSGCQSKETSITEDHFSDSLDLIIKGQLEKARERVKELEQIIENLKKAMITGKELYDNINWDDLEHYEVKTKEARIKELEDAVRQLNAVMIHFATLDKMPTLPHDKQGVLDHVVNIGKKKLSIAHQALAGK